MMSEFLRCRFISSDELPTMRLTPESFRDADSQEGGQNCQIPQWKRRSLSSFAG